jgi:putative hydrolase of the HAD superfamily
MQPFDDYCLIKKLPVDKFLVTTGFPNLQWSKIRMLGIENDFKCIHVVDPDKSSKMKKDIFEELIHQYNYQSDEVLVVGDDPESEIKAAKALNLPTFLFDPTNKYANGTATYQSQRLSAVMELIG